MEGPESMDFNRAEALLGPAEQKELNALRRDQMDGSNWSDEKRQRLLELQTKEDVARGARVV